MGASAVTRLAALRSRLAALRLARGVVRWGCALSDLVLALLAGWAIAYVLDRSLSLSQPGRAVVLLGWIVAIVVYTVPRLRTEWRRSESLEDTALYVERQHRIDSDLIAALQFDAGGTVAWGSPRLSAALVESVAAFAPRLNVFEGFSWRPLPARLGAAAAALAVVVVAGEAFPDEAAAFWNRFALGSARYPTRTVITALEINGAAVPVFHSKPVTLRMAQAESLRVRVEATGALPTEGRIDVRGLKSGAGTSWTLSRSDAGFQAAPQSLVESVRLRVCLGDAVSDPVEIAVVPLPIVDVRFAVSPPSYAPSADGFDIPGGAHQFAVLAGSGLACELTSVNKRLQSARLKLPQGEFTLIPGHSGGRTMWRLPPGTPLENITEPLSYEFLLVDEDGLSPQPPLAGQIRLRPDRAPRVASAMASKKVLPTARPRISYGAVDDFGITRIVMTIEVTAAQGESRREERVVWSKAVSSPSQTTVRGETVLDLAPLNLTQGDRVQIVLEAEDDRGAAPVQRGAGDPIVLEVTDRNGILSGLLETDQQSAKQLDAIILRELGIGGGTK